MSFPFTPAVCARPAGGAPSARATPDRTSIWARRIMIKDMRCNLRSYLAGDSKKDTPRGAAAPLTRVKSLTPRLVEWAQPMGAAVFAGQQQLGPSPRRYHRLHAGLGQRLGARLHPALLELLVVG